MSNSLVVCQAWCQNFEGVNATLMQKFYEGIKTDTTKAQFETMRREMDMQVAGGARHGRTVLHRCVEVGNVELAQYVIERYGCFMVNLGDCDGQTPLHLACSLDDNDVAFAFASLFVRERAVVNICGRDGSPVTPLMLAREKNNTKVIDLLIRRGAADVIVKSPLKRSHDEDNEETAKVSRKE